jgi:predicted NBD/HSP70 family sugar kinase
MAPMRTELPTATSGPSQPITGDQRLVKNINRMALLRLLRDVPGLSRADLADRSGLTRSTVSLLSKQLLEEGWIAEDDALVTGSLGRRPTPLRLDGRRLALIGAELTPETLRVVTTSVQGEVLESAQAALRQSDPDPACHQLVEMVGQMARRWVRGGRQVLGIGVGLPGAVDANSGVLLFAPNMGWRQVAVGARLRAELAEARLADVPVYCQNEADLAAVGEAEFSPRPVADPLVFISCGIGVGSGIVLGQTLFTGATGAGGEIGHTTLHIGGRKCSCGRKGCAEAYVGLRAIASEAGFLAKDGAFDWSGLRSAVAGRHAKSRAAFEAAGASLGVLLQNVWTTFDPKAIVLGGEAVSLGGATYVDAALKVFEAYAKAAGVAPPTVRVARYADQAVAVGGAAYALYSLMNPYLPLQQQSAG